MKYNYQKKLEEILKREKEGKEKKSLLLHSCCGPCSTYVLECLREYFNISVFFYNPCIYPEDEFMKRKEEQVRFIHEWKNGNEIKILIPEYDHEEYNQAIKGFEKQEEGGARCKECFKQRLTRAGEYAAQNNFQYLCSTLTVSPHKNAEWVNEVGEEAVKGTGVIFLPSDFKKKEGYKRSVTISKEYDLYRQDYCGCEYSKKFTKI